MAQTSSEDGAFVLSARAKLAANGAERRANGAEMKFLDKMRDRALTEGEEFSLTEEQRQNYGQIVSSIERRLDGRWRKSR